MTSDRTDRTATFDAARYWSDRLGHSYSLAGVGWLGLGEPFNRWMYAVRRRVFRRSVRGRLPVERARVLDVGSGTGFYVGLWRELGASDITGSDLTALAVERLRERFPDLRFKQVDISAAPNGVDGPYDAISAMDVLFHIVDDDAYERSIGNLSALLKPGGLLVFSENLPHGKALRAEHQTSRSLEDVSDLVRRFGLEMELRRPMFVLMNTPVDSQSKLLERSWTIVSLLAARGPRLGSMVGCLLYPLELGLTHLLTEGPSTEIVVCRKCIVESGS